MNQTSSKRLGARIKQLRKRNGKKMTQEQVGKVLNLHQAAVSRIENGEQQLLAVQLPELAQAFKVRVCEFFEVRG